ncbi:uncharacterized protein LOC130507151 [Raphanus sativus]|uniref:Uncharacterized protein LOC108858736 n=1 Tax=Raphanus sativus TaxID=3726 RepID=A0A6J0NVG4_RAPSA|nr:uncharacterized protein LOC108858736 [Raphanus sativus]XP_056857841.1 uncharacterized protein LOC130507151 [Raphanus sativus]
MSFESDSLQLVKLINDAEEWPAMATEWNEFIDLSSSSTFSTKAHIPNLKPTPQGSTTTDHRHQRLITCKTDAAWNKDHRLAGVAWVFTGAHLEAPIEGTAIEKFVGSPLVAEAMALRSALCMAQTLEVSSLNVFSDNRTLIRAITGNTQSKEIIDIVKDIRLISSEFATISFSHFRRSENSLADSLAK